MNIYYYANNMYQFSYSKSLYEQAGGQYIVGGGYPIKRLDRFARFKWFFRQMNAHGGRRGLLNTPPVMMRDVSQPQDLEGIIFSHSNVNIHTDPSRCPRIFIGHGTGDKPYGGNRTGAENFLNYDYIFLSGPKHLERLKDSGIEIPEERLVKIGNMRFDQVVNGDVSKDSILDRLGVKDRTRKNVLYAPTWRFGNGTFKKYVHRFAKEITSEYNLIVRPHFHDAKHIPRTAAWARKEGIRHLYFSNPSDLRRCDTMDDFVAADIMVSDTSSVLYEYLITGNPIIVVNANYKKLHNMPDEMNIMSITDVFQEEDNIVSMITDNLENDKHRTAYKEMLETCFYFNDGNSTQRAVDFITSIKQ
ncbi:CDP-glycerol glycerophosphotransferase family protein [bacterium]|nr:CDP-glycerol glycerophosphotransferase family protein [bacterium]